MLRSEVLANRKKAVAFLQEPERKKAVGVLDEGDGSRCCLGHMCKALELPEDQLRYSSLRVTYGEAQNAVLAPKELRDALGFRCGSGANETDSMLGPFPQQSLAAVNDRTDATPQEIGAYLESVIEGGPNTPWVSLDTYPEH